MSHNIQELKHIYLLLQWKSNVVDSGASQAITPIQKDFIQDLNVFEATKLK